MASKRRNRVLWSFTCFMLLTRPSYSQIDTLLQGQQLRDGQELFSENGTFKLGFFRKTEKRYVAIWYSTPTADEKKNSSEKPVWIANRNTPIIDNSGILTIDGTDGNLKISHSGGDPIVLNSVPGVSNNTSATLLESGNLVLREHNLDGSIKILWQSFDYPTDTLLPGMKLGIDLKTGLNRSLTSWRSDQTPASGSFTLGMDPNGTNQLVIWWRGDIFWTSGHWHNDRFGLSDLLPYYSSGYNFSYISNENEKFFNYSVNKVVTNSPKLTISEEGDLVQHYNRSVVHCESLSVYSSSGCVQQKLPECRMPYDQYFERYRVFRLSDGLNFSQSDNLTLADCRDKCLNDCSCVAYASSYYDGTGCEIWRKRPTLTFSYSYDDGAADIYILETKANKWWSWWIWLIVSVGGTVLLFCSLYVTWKKCKANGVKRMKQKMLLNELGGNAMASTTYGQAETRKKDGNELYMFSFESISAATNNFSTLNKLGQGGYGPVYKGKLHDGQEIAIKRLSRSSGQGLVEFKNEAILIAKLQHTNLVRLLGFCIQGEEKILIYEYMPNKSLDFFLFDSSKKNMLNWKKRFSIIEGIAQGLLYLHKYSRLRVIHRDLKASNILLDDQMNPKISDFGMARIFGPNESEANTNRIVGTYGYMSPEYAMNGIVSTKTDVFSFGVLLLEIVSSKKNNSFYHSEPSLNLIGYAWQLWKEGQGLELIDPTLDEFGPPSELLRCIHVGLLCVQYYAIDRPTMSEVVSMLLNDTISLAVPKQPAFFIETTVEEPGVPVNELENCSINQVVKAKIYSSVFNISESIFILQRSIIEETPKNILKWKKPLSNIKGIAQGLIYLHKYSRIRVIHTDLKASNILLDDDMNPKISNFGMAKIFGVDESQANMNRVVGTYDYMSAEYAINGIVSMKTDVFSFGVLLLEIVSDKNNNSCYQSGCTLNLIGYLWNEGRGLKLINPALDESCPQNEFLRCIHVGLLCVQYHAIDRPTISEVVSML